MYIGFIRKHLFVRNDHISTHFGNPKEIANRKKFLLKNRL